MRFLGEAGAYLGLLAALAAAAPVRRYLAAIPRPHQAMLAALFALLVAGQLINQPRRTFPFTSWAMYGRIERQETLAVYRCRGVDAQGRRVTLEPEHMFRSAGKSGIASKLKHLVQGSSLGGRPAGGAGDHRLDAFLAAVGAAHNRLHPDARVRSVELVELSLALNGPPGPRPGEQLLRERALAAARP